MFWFTVYLAIYVLFLVFRLFCLFALFGLFEILALFLCYLGYLNWSYLLQLFENVTGLQFLQRSAKHSFAMLRQIRPSVRHTPLLCQNDQMQRDAVFTIGYRSVSSFLTPRMVDRGRPCPGKI